MERSCLYASTQLNPHQPPRPSKQRVENAGMAFVKGANERNEFFAKKIQKKKTSNV